MPIASENANTFLPEMSRVSLWHSKRFHVASVFPFKTMFIRLSRMREIRYIYMKNIGL